MDGLLGRGPEDVLVTRVPGRVSPDRRCHRHTRRDIHDSAARVSDARAPGAENSTSAARNLAHRSRATRLRCHRRVAQL